MVRVHRLRKFQGSSSGEVDSIGRDALIEQRRAGKQPVKGGYLLQSLLARSGASGVGPDVAQVAAAIWDEVTGGAGVVLVDGQPVKTATEAAPDGGESEALP